MHHGWWGGWRCAAAAIAAGFAVAAAPGTASAISVKAACAGPVPSGHARCFALRRTDVAPAGTNALTNAVPTGYGPADLQDAYRLPSATGGIGQTIAIVDAYDDPTAAGDLAVYRSQYGLPPVTLTKVNQYGQTSPLPPVSTGWAGEISLDLDMASAICPNCNILLVEANSAAFTDLGTGISTAVRLGARFVSNSWGGAERSDETSQPYTGFLNHPGVAITAATGDDGFGSEWPAASPVVTAVGGTRLLRGPVGWIESAWAGGGAGCSRYEPNLWQTNAGCGTHRTIADVAAIADPNPGVAVYQTTGGSGWTVYGGTSVSAAIVAGVYALAGSPGDGDYPAAYPYHRPTALNDVTSGADALTCSPLLLCTAGVGYDGPTGLGTPNGIGAFTANGLASATSLAASPNPATVGSQVTLTATVTGSGATPTGSVTFSDGSDAIGSAPIDGSGHAALSVATLSVGTHSITASYAGDASYNPSTSAALGEVVNVAAASPVTTISPTKKKSSKSGAASTSAAAGSPILACAGSPVALIDAIPQGNVVRISGVAANDYVGKTVQISLASTDRVIATTRVHRGGAFQALVRLPAPSARAATRYTATVAGQTSAALKLQRRAYLTKVHASQGRLTIAGMVTGPFRKGALVRVEELTHCGNPLAVASTRLSGSGKWKVTVFVSGDPSGVLFRARTTVRSGGRTSTAVTVPHPVTG